MTVLDLPADVAAAVTERLAALSPARRAEALRRLDAELTRRRFLAEAPTPLDLAARLNPRYKATPAHEKINGALVDTDSGEHLRFMVTMGSQLGKSELVSHYGPLWSVLRHPERRHAVASYQQGVAAQHVEAARLDVQSNPDNMGVTLSKAQATKTWWRLEGHRGGLLAVGVGSGFTGRPADWLSADDLYAGRAEATSPVIRGNVRTWWDYIAGPRLHPLAPVILTFTRWHPDDLIGELLKEQDADPSPDPRFQWRLLNFPARAGQHSRGRPIPDALDRQPGEWLVTFRGHHEDDGAAWQRLRRQVGPTAFAAIYMGDPLPDEGGLFSEEHIAAYRVRPDQCPDLSIVAVAVDPAVTGTGDEAGIVAGGSVRGHVYVTHDRSGLLNEAGWSRGALLLALDVQADRVVYEKNRTPEGDKLIKRAWAELLRHATALKAAGGSGWGGTPDEDVIEAAALALVRGGQALPGLDVDEEPPDAAELRRVEELLREEWPYAGRILAHPVCPFRVVAVHATRGKAVRAAPVAQQYETGRVHHVGELPQLEDEQVSWAEGAESPNRLDALVWLVTHLGAAQPATVQRPTQRGPIPTRTAGMGRR